MKFGTGKFFEMRVPKIILRIHKNKSVLSYFTFQGLVMLDQNWSRKGKWQYNYSKSIFSLETKDINLTFPVNWDWVIFEIFQNNASKLMQFLTLL